MANSKKYIERIGFILSYPLSNTNNLDNKLAIQFNKLIAKLNHKYPDYFPSIVYNNYFITTAYIKEKKLQGDNQKLLVSNEKNLLRLKNELENLKIIICFGEKAYFAAKKVKELYNLDYKIIKTKSFAYPVSRHIKTLYNNKNKHIRSNFNVLTQFKDIDKQLTEMS